MYLQENLLGGCFFSAGLDELQVYSLSLQLEFKRALPQTYLRDIFARHLLTKFQVYSLQVATLSKITDFSKLYRAQQKQSIFAC